MGGEEPGKQLIVCVLSIYFFILHNFLKDTVTWDFLSALLLNFHNSAEPSNSRLEAILFVQPTYFLVVAGRETRGCRTAYFPGPFSRASAVGQHQSGLPCEMQL